MLNLFSYADSDEEGEDNKTVVEPQKKIVEEKENDSQERKKEKSVFAELPKAKKSKGKKQLNLEDIARLTQVPIEELRKEFSGKEEEEEKKKEKQTTSSLFDSLPKPSNTQSTSINQTTKNEVNDTNSEKSISNIKSTITENEDENELEEQEKVTSNGVIPLNPFLDDMNTIQSEEKETPVVYKTVYHVPQRKREYSEVSSIQPTEMEDTTSYSETPTIGYGSNYSQSQYEAFMRRSGMLATATAATTASANMLGEDAQYYDKQTKQALETGNIIELNQNDLHDHSAQPDSEYWQRKQRKAAVAAQFGKYAHIAPTQVQQTRNQITYLASQAIEQLADIDNRRAQQRKTRREVRAKYGW